MTNDRGVLCNVTNKFNKLAMKSNKKQCNKQKTQDLRGSFNVGYVLGGG